jgi:hypothetical protein
MCIYRKLSLPSEPMERCHSQLTKCASLASRPAICPRAPLVRCDKSLLPDYDAFSHRCNSPNFTETIPPPLEAAQAQPAQDAAPARIDHQMLLFSILGQLMTLILARRGNLNPLAICETDREYSTRDEPPLFGGDIFLHTAF